MQDERPIGPVVEGWRAPPAPDGTVLQGRYAYLEPLDADAHAALLYDAFDGQSWIWDYMPVGPFSSSSQFYRWMQEATSKDDIHFYAIRDLETGEWGGFASYLRVKPMAGAIEVGFIAMAPCLQKTRAATEAMYLMMQWAFEVGYRRYEWKCDALNRPSRRAAQRLGFSYEGVFRQALLVKGRNRDTAWFAVIDKEWSALKEAFQLWLNPNNFDERGQQRERLSDLTALVRAASDPTL
jgi:RimJ/RimL family protein N-acetyltransferase